MTKAIERRQFLRLSLTALASSAFVPLSACTGTGTETTTTTPASSEVPSSLRVGAEGDAWSAGYWVADLQGYFSKYGIDAQVITFSYGIDTLNAILTGQLDVGMAADYAVLSRLSSKKLKVLAYVEQQQADSLKIVARDGITAPEQLEGTSFGVARATVGEYETTLFLAHYGIQNVNWIELSSTSEIVAALQRGDIQAAIFSGNSLEQALTVEGATVIGSMKVVNFSPRSFLVSSADYAESNPEVLSNLLKAVDEALQWVNADKEQAASALAASLVAPKENVLKDLNNYSFEVRLATDDVQQLKNINDDAAKSSLYDTNFELTNYIDTNPIELALPNKLTYKASDLT